MTASPFDDDWVEPAAPPPPPPPEPKAAKPARAKAEPKPFADAPTRAAADRPAREPQPEAEPAIQHPTEIVDGIYFGMIDDAYHAIERLSSSGIQKLLVSPANFWEDSWLNPRKAEKEAKREKVPRTVGRAYHTARLEPHLFDAGYVRGLDKADMPDGTLFTGADMGAALAEMDLPKSGSVAEQAARLVANGYDGTIWQVELARWEAERGDRVGLPAAIYDDLVEDMHRIQSCEGIRELLEGGAAEVSIFWTCPATSIPMKARLDYLRPRAWTDFKTFDNSRGKRLEQAIADAFRYNRYYVQAVSYRDAVEAIRNGVVDIVGDATEAERDLVAAVQLAPASLECWYVFQEKSGVPNILGRRFRFDDRPLLHPMHAAGLDEQREAAAAEAVGRPTAITTKAVVEIQHAKRLYAGYSEIYDRGDPWLPIEPLADIGDADFNSYWLEGRE